MGQDCEENRTCRDAVATTYCIAEVMPDRRCRVPLAKHLSSGEIDQIGQPSRTSLPIVLPLSTMVWAFKRFLASIGPATSLSVVRMTPLSTRVATFVNSLCCSIMSVVLNLRIMRGI